MRTKIEDRTAFPWSVKEPLLKETKGKCAHCGTPLDRYSNLTVDHVIPLNKGGTNDPENLTVLCEECNKLKSDMVVKPKEWYPFLPKKRHKALVKLTAEYCKNTDYLSENCVMMLDTFSFYVGIVSHKNRAGSNPMRLPVSIQGTRMERDNAFNWLMEYKRSLQWRDACATHKQSSEIKAPCYILKKGDIELAMIEPYLKRTWETEFKAYDNSVCINWFFSPDMPDRDYLPGMLANVIEKTEQFIGTCISATMIEGASLIRFQHKCFISDHFCSPVFDLISEGRANMIKEYDTGNRITARIRIACSFSVVGEYKAAKELSKKINKMQKDGLLSTEEILKMGDAFNKRFENKE